MHVNFFCTAQFSENGYATVLKILKSASYISSSTTYSSDTYKQFNFSISSLKSRILKFSLICALFDFLIFIKHAKRLPKEVLNIGVSEHYAVLLYLLKKITGIEYVLYAHGTYVFLPKERYLYRIAFNNAKHVIFDSNYTFKEYSKFMQNTNNCVIIPLGVDTNVFHIDKKINKTDTIIFVGNDKERKGLKVLISALNKIQNANITFELVVVGQISFSTLSKIQNELTIQIRHYTNISNCELRTLYQRAKINVLLSQHVGNHFEGFGLVHLEANACGTWTVGSYTSGNPDAVKAGNGDIIGPTDVDLLSEIIQRKLLEEPYIYPASPIKSNAEYVSELRKIIVHKRVY